MLKDQDLRLFRKACKKLGAVDARTSSFNAGDMAFGTGDPSCKVIHCFNRAGAEVCLWYSGTSRKYREFDKPRQWAPHMLRRTFIAARKEEDE